MNKISESYNQLPSWSKGVVAVGGIAILGFVIWNAYKKIKEAKSLQEALIVSKDAKEEANALQRKGIKASYSQTQYESLALKLVEAMNGCGTSLDSVKSVFELMKNKTDVLRLIETFGVRYYRPCPATDPFSYALYMYNEKKFGGNIQTWLQYDLSQSEISSINSILSLKNIEFKF